MSAPGVKILLCGDVHGKLHALYKRFDAVNKAAGPFAALFCVGAFLPPLDGQPGDLPAFLSGDAAAPVPTYFLDALPGGRGLGLLDLGADRQLAPNLFFLCGGGVADIAGLRVAFLGGHFDALAFADAGAAAAAASLQLGEFRASDLAEALKALEPPTGEPPQPVDLLLTASWPRGAANACSPAVLQAAAAAAGCAAEALLAASNAGAPCLAQLAAAASPRYHAAGGAGLFFLRPPFRNEAKPGAPGVTRFVGLAPLGSQPGGNKWLHALQMTPARQMSSSLLSASAPDATASPYTSRPPQQAAMPHAPHMAPADAAQPWRWEGGARGSKRQRAPDAGPADAQRTLFLRNLAYSLDEEALRAHFSTFGEVVDVRIALGADGRPRGIGHLEFRDAAHAAAALSVGGASLGGRQVRVEAAAHALSDVGDKRAAHGVTAPGEAAPGCWFCLSNAKDVHLIASVGEHCYLATDKGALCESHVLVVPVEHYASSDALPPPAAAELWRYLAALRACFASGGAGAPPGAGLLAFERHFALRSKGGNHAHVNCLALPPAACAGARAAVEAACAREACPLLELPAASGAEEMQATLRAALPAPGVEFFLVTLPDGGRLLHVLRPGGRMGMQLGREVAAALLGEPGRADWRACTGSQAEEEERCARLKAGFGAFDPFGEAA